MAAPRYAPPARPPCTTRAPPTVSAADQAAFKETFLAKAKKAVSKGAKPDRLRLGDIPRNFKGAVQVKDLVKRWKETGGEDDDGMGVQDDQSANAAPAPTLPNPPTTPTPTTPTTPPSPPTPPMMSISAVAAAVVAAVAAVGVIVAVRRMRRP